MNCLKVRKHFFKDLDHLGIDNSKRDPFNKHKNQSTESLKQQIFHKVPWFQSIHTDRATHLRQNFSPSGTPSYIHMSPTFTWSIPGK